jgi:hypothetical protein
MRWIGLFGHLKSRFTQAQVSKTLVSILVLSLLSFGGTVITAPVASAAPAAGIGLGNGLQMFLKTESGATSAATTTRFNSGTCFVGVVSQLNFSDFNSYTSCGTAGSTTREGFTGYFRGYILAPASETFSFWSSNDDGLDVKINGTQVISNWADTGPGAYGTFNTNAVSNTFAMTQGRIYPIEIQYHQNAVGATLKLYWSYPSCSGCSTKATAQIIPQSQLGTSSADLGTDCAIGMSEACPASSAVEIKNLTATNTDGLYWITSAGISTQVYSLMNSNLGGGGWQLAMKGKSSASTFGYSSPYWTDQNTLNSTAPSRISSSDSDAKYSTFYGNFANQMMALFPSYSGSTYGGAYPSAGYGFAWSESITGMSAWTAYNGTTLFGGNSYATNMTNGPQGSGGCRSTPSTLRDMFASSNRCAIRQVQPTYSGTEAYPNGTTAGYYAAGNNMFATQKDVRFFGINYGINSTNANTRARWGFGFNENGAGEESSNDVLGGIGLGGPSITAGTYMGCCSATGGGGQAGVSGNANGSSTNMAFELYVRESGVQFTSSSQLRTVAGTSASLTLSATKSSGANNISWNIPQLISGLSFNAASGVLTASASLAAGTYYETATAIDDTGARATLPLNIYVAANSGETDTAISLSGSQYLFANSESSFDFASGTTFTLEAWVKPQVTNANQIIIGKDGQYSLILCSTGFFGWNFMTTNTPSGVGDDRNVFGNRPARANEWQHVAIVRSGGVLSGYVDGQLVGSTTTSATDSIKSGSSPFVIGGYSTSNQAFRGQIDQVRVWSTAQTQTQIASGMSTFLPSSQTGLIASYGFNENLDSQIFNNATSATWGTDLSIAGGNTSLTQIAETSTSGAYSIITFRRSYLVSQGGWRSPAGVSKITAVVVAGGGGGGAESDDTGWFGGGGGAGGYQVTTLADLAQETMTVQVGVGGRGGQQVSRGAVADSLPTNGVDSKLKTITSIGGGSGGVSFTSGRINGSNGGSGGGGATYGGTGGTATAGQGNQGGTSAAGCCAGGGGGGFGSAGGNGSAATAGSSTGGSAGNGVLNPIYISGISPQYLAAGGAGGSYTNAGSAGSMGGTPAWTNGTANSGSGGGGGGSSSTNPDKPGGYGGSGIVIVRWITASSPTFTSLPVVDTTTALTRYTFRSGGSATSPLTRTYLWQYSSDTGTTWSTLQTSTSDSYTTSSLDLGTSGLRYKYRVVVTDSDTAGLSITDSSTAYLILNRYPTISPPLSNDSGLLVHLDASQAASYSGSGTTWNDLSGGGRNASLSNSSTFADCTSGPNFLNTTNSAGGNFEFSSGRCAYIPSGSFSTTPSLDSFTVETWMNPSQSQTSWAPVITTRYSASTQKVNFALIADGSTDASGNPRFRAGFYTVSSNWQLTDLASVPVNSWSHVTMTASGSSLILYINGVVAARNDNTSGIRGGINDGVLIGRKWDQNLYYVGKIATVRISNSALTAAQVKQNYYSSSNRFSNSVSGIKSSTKLYAGTLTETFTASNGTGNKTFTITPNNRAGISWDTRTVNTAVLSVAATNLTVGTYYETLTATDSASATTTLALTITVDKSNQAALSIGQYNAYPGISTYPLNVYGGSGTGTVTRSLSSAGSAGCTLASSMFLSATTAGTCTVQAVKAADTNYYAETATATIYWIQWSDAYATRVPSTPTEIVLNHQTAITKYNFETLTVTSYQNSSGVTITTVATGATLRIIGDGFSPTAAYTEVVFASMDSIDLTTGLSVVSNGSGGYYLQLTVPSGVTSGAVTVNSPKGTAVGPSLTITP